VKTQKATRFKLAFIQKLMPNEETQQSFCSTNNVSGEGKIEKTNNFWENKEISPMP
jgi:hypothetical protein